MDNLDNKNFIQIIFNLSVIRIYYIQKNYYVCYVDMENIIPKIFKKANELKLHIDKILLKKNNIDIRFFYNSLETKNKTKIKILDMNGYYNNTKMIHKLLLLLLIE